MRPTEGCRAGSPGKDLHPALVGYAHDVTCMRPRSLKLMEIRNKARARNDHINVRISRFGSMAPILGGSQKPWLVRSLYLCGLFGLEKQHLLKKLWLRYSAKSTSWATFFWRARPILPRCSALRRNQTHRDCCLDSLQYENNLKTA